MRLPAYFKQPLPDKQLLKQRNSLLETYRINTVCRSARCPNYARCLSDNTATFMILGRVCTRHCLFCAVDKGKPVAPDKDEPRHIACAVKEMGLDYAVITSVTRDDLSDFGAAQFVRVIEEMRFLSAGTKIELLIPDFSGSTPALEKILRACPDCIGHNLEAARTIYPLIKRDIGQYDLSLSVLKNIRKINCNILIKSGIILGLGEDKEEVKALLADLRDASCDIVTIGQYLSPSQAHFSVKRFLGLNEFEEYKQMAYNLGFKAVKSGPLVRSSYKAKEAYEEAAICMT